MDFDFRYNASKSSVLGRDIIKLLSDAELKNSVSTQSADALRMFATLLMESDICELRKHEID